MKLIALWLFASVLAAVGDCRRGFTVTSRIYMDVKHNKQPLGRITFGLFGKLAPKAAANFRHICLRGINGTSYVGARFHRVVDRFLVQGGDILNGDGTGSISIYGDYFEDEEKGLEVEHNRPGYLGMANRGPHTNGCQFYVTTVGAKWLDGKHTVFGKVLEGMDTIYAIEDVRNIYISLLLEQQLQTSTYGSTYLFVI